MSLLHLAKLFLLVYSWNFHLSRLNINAHILFLTQTVKTITALPEHRADSFASCLTLV